MKLQMTRPYKQFYAAWAGLYALTAALGFIPEPEGALSTLLTLLSVAFFLPPWLIIYHARKADHPGHLRLIRYLAAAWVILTVVLMCANILSVGQSDAVGSALYYVMTVACAPMVCSQVYVLPIALWGTLLALTKTKKKKD